MEGVVGEAFARALATERERFNAMFLQARRESPALNGDHFLAFLRSTLDPLVTTAATTHPQLVAATAVQLYEASLTLFRRNLVGPEARVPEFAVAWRRLLDHILSLSQLDPKQLIAPLSNALHHLFHTPDCQAEHWVARMNRAAVHCTDAKQLLQVGQILAWTAGMVQYRRAALAVARDLPAPLVSSILEDNPPTGLSAGELLDVLESSPWSMGHTSGTRTLDCVAKLGSFRGLGGQFAQPPTVFADGDDLYATDGHHHWLILADAFGQLLHRTELVEQPRAGESEFHATPRGVVQGPKTKATFEMFAKSSSQAGNQSTLALTLPHSHRIFLIAEVLR